MNETLLCVHKKHIIISIYSCIYNQTVLYISINCARHIWGARQVSLISSPLVAGSQEAVWCCPCHVPVSLYALHWNVPCPCLGLKIASKTGPWHTERQHYVKPLEFCLKAPGIRHLFAVLEAQRIPNSCTGPQAGAKDFCQIFFVISA